MGPLNEYRVLDLSQFVAGPYCSMLLGDMGADVIKIEKKEGDNGRYMKPAIGDMSTYFMISNRNKRSITLNLKHNRGKELMLELVKKADVLVENFRPGVMKKLGLNYNSLREINPRIIMVSISGFGQDGPYAQKPAFDSVAQAMGGLMDQTGHEDRWPVPAGTWVADYGSGVFAAFGALLALHDREKSGKGQHVDIALLDTIVAWLRTSVPDYLLFGIKRGRKGGRDLYRCPVGSFPTSNGYIYVSATTQTQFKQFATVAGHPEWATDPRFCCETQRLANSEELTSLLSEWTSSFTTEEVISVLEGADVPCAAIANIEQVVNNPQLKHRKQIVPVETSGGEELQLPGINIKLSETPGSIRMGPPRKGEHNNEIYGDLLGLTDLQLDDLRKNGVI